jgi:hypothetical protein
MSPRAAHSADQTLPGDGFFAPHTTPDLPSRLCSQVAAKRGDLFSEPHTCAATKPTREVGRGADGESGLAYAAWADQTDEPARGEPGSELAELTPPTDEGGRLGGQVAQPADGLGHVQWKGTAGTSYRPGKR